MTFYYVFSYNWFIMLIFPCYYASNTYIKFCYFRLIKTPIRKKYNNRQLQDALIGFTLREFSWLSGCWSKKLECPRSSITHYTYINSEFFQVAENMQTHHFTVLTTLSQISIARAATSPFSTQRISRKLVKTKWNALMFILCHGESFQLFSVSNVSFIDYCLLSET